MRSRDKKLNWLAVAKTFADMGAGLGVGGPGGAWGQNLQGTISNLAQGIEAEKQAEEEKKKNSGLGGIGSILGGIVGNAILPGAGGAIGGMLGSAGGQAVGGGDVNVGSVVQSGVGGYMGGKGATPSLPPVQTAPPPAPVVAPALEASNLPAMSIGPTGMNQLGPIYQTQTTPPPAVPTAVDRPSFMSSLTNSVGPTIRANVMLNGGYTQPMDQKPNRYRYDEEYGWTGY